MKYNIKNTNDVSLIGKIASEFKFSHEVYGERFYESELAVKRLSGYIDHIPLMISEKYIDPNKNYIGEYVKITGEFRSHNIHENDNLKLKLYVMVQSIESDNNTETRVFCNRIILEGYICKAPIHRKTSASGLEITDLIIAVNRNYGRTNYIPCICWNNQSIKAMNYNAGDHICLVGRIQSREYIKKLDDNTTETRTAYEVSASTVKLINNMER